MMLLYKLKRGSIVAIISDDDNIKFDKQKNEDTTAEETSFDMSFESNIRPKLFNEYIGQSALKATLQI